MKAALFGFCVIKPHCYLSSCIPLILKENIKKYTPSTNYHLVCMSVLNMLILLEMRHVQFTISQTNPCKEGLSGA